MTENDCESIAHEVAEKLLEDKKNRDRIVLAGCIALVLGTLLGVFLAYSYVYHTTFSKWEKENETPN